MVFDDGEIVEVSEDHVGVTYTHWCNRKLSWRLRWSEVERIDAMQIEPVTMGLAFIAADQKWRYILEDMEGWNDLIIHVRRQFPTLDWNKFEEAKQWVDFPVTCWVANG